MQKYIPYEPSTDEVYGYQMRVRRDEEHCYYDVNPAILTETQRKILAERYGIPLNILECEPLLTLVKIVDI